MSENIENILAESEKNKTTDDMLANIQSSMNYQVDNKVKVDINNLKELSEVVTNIPRKYGYVPKMTIIFSDGTIFDLLEFTNIIQVEINLEYYVFPLISIKLNPPVNFIPKIQNDDDLEITFELLYNAYTESDAASMYDTLWNIKLKKIKQESSPIIIDELFYQENEQYLRKAPIELKLIPTECLRANKNLFSGVYGDCTVSQMLCLITDKLNYNSYITPSENVRKYKQIIFPPCNTFYAIEYLDQYYGLYDRGLKMFYGFGQSIIMSKNQYIENGLNKVLVSFNNNVEQGLDMYMYNQGGFDKKGNDNYITITPNHVKVLDRKHYIKETLGTVVTTYSRDDHAYFEQAREYDYTAGRPNLEKVKSYVNQYNNTNKEKEFLLQSAYTKQIELELLDVIIPPDDWFKAFTINFESPNYSNLNGTYSLQGYYFRFTKVNTNSSSAEFNVDSYIELIEF